MPSIYLVHRVLLQGTKNILGMNERSFLLAQSLKKHQKRLADNKIQTKQFFETHRVPTAPLFGTIKNIEELEAFHFSDISEPFVVKPNRGYGGNGILVLMPHGERKWKTPGGKVITEAVLRAHITDILFGQFSMSGRKDYALIEHKVDLDERIQLLGQHGLPDIRVIVYKGVPVMAAMRLAGSDSDGKANLHAGGYYASIDMTTGKILDLYKKGGHVQSFEEYGDIRGVVLPDWDEVLRVAAQTQLSTGIPLLGCDIVPDNSLGPILLEINVRPGLEIQVVNKDGLGRRLRKVADLRVTTAEKGVRLAKDMFGVHDVESRGKPVLRLHEGVELLLQDSVESIYALPFVQPDREYNTLHIDLLKGAADYVAGDQIRLMATLGGQTLATLVTVVNDGNVGISLGRTLTERFLIDHATIDIENDISLSIGVNAQIRSSHLEKIQTLDAEMKRLETALSLVPLSRPLNLEQQKSAFIASKGSLVPEIEYRRHGSVEYDQLYEDIESLHISSSLPLHDIFLKKKAELLVRFQLVNAFQASDDAGVSEASQMLYGTYSDEDLEEAQRVVDQNYLLFSTDSLDTEQVKHRFSYFLSQYESPLRIRENASMLSRASLSASYFNIHPNREFYSQEIRAVFAHEFETHALRRINGEHMGLDILSRGTAGYLRTEEGLAILNQSQFLTEGLLKRSSSARLLLALDAVQRMEYTEWVAYLVDLYGGDYERVFNVIIRLKRGIHDVSSPHVFVKDSVYFSGYCEVVSYLWSGGQYEDLYLGKIHLEDIPSVKSYLAVLGKKVDRQLPHFSPLLPHSMNTL